MTIFQGVYFLLVGFLAGCLFMSVYFDPKLKLKNRNRPIRYRCPFLDCSFAVDGVDPEEVDRFATYHKHEHREA